MNPFRRTAELRRVDADTDPMPPERTHELPEMPWRVGWAQETESYHVSGPGAPDTGLLESVDALAEAVAPVPVPERVRAALHADRATRPPIPDAWRRRVDTVQALLAPLGNAVTQVTPDMAGGARAQGVEVYTDPAVPRAAERARELLAAEGYVVRDHGALEGAYLVLRAGEEAGPATGDETS